MNAEEIETLRQKAVDILKTVYDPEIPVDIWELGLVYDVSVDDEGNAHIVMTLTTPNCPAAESLPAQVKHRVGQIEGIKDVDVEVVWEPPWNPQMMSEAARLQLGYM
ncbi:MAG TPA: SUF system Fe-S cluster assembly protein [Calditrichaeota bacterium]|nr:SUF system Fe-S cluster assembly protein [Calditrichota bacterium]